MSKLNKANSKSNDIIHGRNIELVLESLYCARKVSARSESGYSTLIQSIALLEILISAKNDVSKDRIMSSNQLKSRILAL